MNAAWALDVIFFHNALPQYTLTCVNHSKCAPFHNACHLFTCGFMIPNFSILLFSFKWCTRPIVPPSHYAPCYILPFLYALFSLYHIYFLPFPLIPYLFNYFYSSFIHLVLFTLIMFLSHWAPRATQGSFIISRYVILNDYFTSHKLNIQKCSFIWLFFKNDRILYHFVLRKIIIICLFSSMLPPNPFLLS